MTHPVTEALASVRNYHDKRDVIRMVEEALAKAQKYPDSDAAVQIAYEAHQAGYRAAADRARAFHPTKIMDDTAHAMQAWCDFEPSEECKELCK